MRILVVNAGSTTLKLRALDEDDRLLSDQELPASRGLFDEAAVASAVEAIPDVQAVGHRVVHGGGRFAEAVHLDREVEDYLGRVPRLL